LKSFASARGLCSGFRNKDTKVAASASVVSGSGRELAGVGVDGIAGGNGEIRGELIERKPADFAGLPRFAVLGAASSYAAPIRWGNPMLAFLRQEMVGNAKKTLDGDIDTHFLTSFAKCAFCKGLQVFQLAANDTPATCFGRQIAEREKHPTVLVYDEHADANPRA